MSDLSSNVLENKDILLSDIYNITNTNNNTNNISNFTYSIVSTVSVEYSIISLCIKIFILLMSMYFGYSYETILYRILRKGKDLGNKKNINNQNNEEENNKEEEEEETIEEEDEEESVDEESDIKNNNDDNGRDIVFSSAENYSNALKRFDIEFPNFEEDYKKIVEEENKIIEENNKKKENERAKNRLLCKDNIINRKMDNIKDKDNVNQNKVVNDNKSKVDSIKLETEKEILKTNNTSDSKQDTGIKEVNDIIKQKQLEKQKEKEERKLKNKEKAQPKQKQDTQEKENSDLMKKDSELIQVYFIRTDLGMGPGKIGAQVAHASVWIFEQVFESDNLIKHNNYVKWEKTGQKCLMFKSSSQEEFKKLKSLFNSVKVINVIISDAGHTQIKRGSKTVLCTEPISIKEFKNIITNYSSLAYFK